MHHVANDDKRLPCGASYLFLNSEFYDWNDRCEKMKLRIELRSKTRIILWTVHATKISNDDWFFRNLKMSIWWHYCPHEPNFPLNLETVEWNLWKGRKGPTGTLWTWQRSPFKLQITRQSPPWISNGLETVEWNAVKCQVWNLFDHTHDHQLVPWQWRAKVPLESLSLSL